MMGGGAESAPPPPRYNQPFKSPVLIGLMLLEITTKNTEDAAKLVAYADDFTAAGSIASSKHLWDTLYKIGPKFGYFPQASKTWLIVKSNYLTKATEVFTDIEIQITSSGKRHLGAVIGTTNYKEEYINEKIIMWLSEIRMLCQIAKSEPQSAYTRFTTGLKHKITYYMRTVPKIGHLLQQLDDLILSDSETLMSPVIAGMKPAITEHIRVSELERQLFSSSETRWPWSANLL